MAQFSCLTCRLLQEYHLVDSDASFGCLETLLYATCCSRRQLAHLCESILIYKAILPDAKLSATFRTQVDPLLICHATGILRDPFLVGQQTIRLGRKQLHL